MSLPSSLYLLCNFKIVHLKFQHALLTYSLISYGNSLKLKAQIETIQSNDLKEMKTMVDLGSNFYAQAKM
jgi:hypothetical protein